MGKPQTIYQDGITTESRRGWSPVGYFAGVAMCFLSMWGIVTLLVGEARKTPDHIVALYVVGGVGLLVAGGAGVFLLMRFLILHSPNKDYMSPEAMMMVQEATKREMMMVIAQAQMGAANNGQSIGEIVNNGSRLLQSGNQMHRSDKVEAAGVAVWSALYPHTPPTRANIKAVTGSASDEFCNLVVNYLRDKQLVREGGQGKISAWK